MYAAELFDDQQMTGFLDIPGLAKLLPGIGDSAMFDDAMDKVRNGRESNLTIPEKMQFAAAFISLVGLDQQGKAKVMRLLSSIKGAPSATGAQAPTVPSGTGSIS